jgi:hypothetical protein
MKKLFNLFESLKIVGERIPSINFGGCGVFALELSKVLTEKNIKHHILFMGNSYINDNPCNPSNSLLKKQNKPLAFLNDKNIFLAHVVVIVDNKIIIDGCGCYIEFNEVPFSHCRLKFKIEQSVLEAMVNESNRWNPSYDRENNKLVQKLIKENLVIKK